VEKADNWLHQGGFMEMMEDEHAAMRSSMESPNGLMCLFKKKKQIIFPS
jgi:hypothetical protein